MRQTLGMIAAMFAVVALMVVTVRGVAYADAPQSCPWLTSDYHSATHTPNCLR